jgi:hypothetical protein
MSPAASDAAPIRLVQTIPLPGVEGRIDHLAVDVAGQRLFVAALGNNTVEVVDLKQGVRVRSLPGFKEPQGLAYLADAHTLAVANAGDGVVTLLDGASLAVTRTVDFGDDADNLRYDPARKRLYVGFGAGALGVLDTTSGTRGKDVEIGTHPESFQLDPSSGRIYVNAASKQEVAVVDTEGGTVVARWAVRAGAANYPMTLDAAHRRLFVLTRRPPHLVVFDTAAGQPVATLEADGDSDDVFYDGPGSASTPASGPARSWSMRRRTAITTPSWPRCRQPRAPAPVFSRRICTGSSWPCLAGTGRRRRSESSTRAPEPDLTVRLWDRGVPLSVPAPSWPTGPPGVGSLCPRRLTRHRSRGTRLDPDQADRWREEGARWTRSGGTCVMPCGCWPEARASRRPRS